MHRYTCLALLVSSLVAGAQEPAPAPTAPEGTGAAPTTAPVAPAPSPPAVTTPTPARAPYHTPFQLRSLTAVKALRLDDSLDFNSGGRTDVLFATGLWAFSPRLVGLVRLGGAFNAPTSGEAGNNLLNALVAGQALHAVGDLKVGAFLGVALPIAGGGGNSPAAAAKAANAAGILARSSLDNAMFAANDVSVVPGLSAAWVSHGLTVQLDLTLIELLRVQGELVQADAARTNSTTALHVGYFVLPELSVGAELRYQRWLSTPAAVAKDESQRFNLSAAVGLRGHVKVGGVMLRPGVSYARGLAGTMVPAAHQVVQFDVPIIF